MNSNEIAAQYMLAHRNDYKVASYLYHCVLTATNYTRHDMLWSINALEHPHGFVFIARCEEKKKSPHPLLTTGFRNLNEALESVEENVADIDPDFMNNIYYKNTQIYVSGRNVIMQKPKGSSWKNEQAIKEGKKIIQATKENFLAIDQYEILKKDTFLQAQIIDLTRKKMTDDQIKEKEKYYLECYNFFKSRKYG